MSQTFTIAGRIPVLTLGHRLALARETSGLTQTEIAEACGIARSTVMRYEANTSAPKPMLLMAWALVTGVDLAWLQNNEGPASEETGPADVVRPEGFEPPTYCSGAWYELELAA